MPLQPTEIRRTRNAHLAAAEADGGGSVVVFVHGLSSRGCQFDHQLHVVARFGHRGIAVDLPGHGSSPMPIGGADLDVVADSLASTLDSLGARRVHVVGNSLGGLVGYRFLGRHPERVISLVTFGTTAELQTSRFALLALRVVPRVLGRRGMRMLVGMAASRNRSVSRAFARVADELEASVRRAYTDQIARYDETDLVVNAAVPILLLRCGEDSSINRELDSTIVAMERNPLGQMVDLPDAGHLANLDAAADFDRAVLEFIHEVDRREARTDSRLDG